MTRIWNAYEELKNSLKLKDSADALIKAVASLRNSDYFTKFSKVVMDLFEEEGIRFYSSALEHEALDIIRSLNNVELFSHPMPN